MKEDSNQIIIVFDNRGEQVRLLDKDGESLGRLSDLPPWAQSYVKRLWRELGVAVPEIGTQRYPIINNVSQMEAWRKYWSKWMNFSSLKSDKSTIIVDIHSCARCGAHHEQLEFKPFASPIKDGDGTVWAYWAMCPYNYEPILMRKVEPEQK